MDEEKQRVVLQDRVQEANLVREMCQTPGFKLLQRKFDERLKKATSKLLDMNTTEEDIKKIRQQMMVWTEITNMLKAFVITGQYSSKVLNEEF